MAIALPTILATFLKAHRLTVISCVPKRKCLIYIYQAGRFVPAGNNTILANNSTYQRTWLLGNGRIIRMSHVYARLLCTFSRHLCEALLHLHLLMAIVLRVSKHGSESALRHGTCLPMQPAQTCQCPCGASHSQPPLALLALSLAKFQHQASLRKFTVGLHHTYHKFPVP